MTRRLDIEYVKKTLFNKNIAWMDQEKGYKSKWTKIKLKCLKNNCNYEWCTSFQSVRQTPNGCSKCPQKAISHPPKSYLNNLAKNAKPACSCGGKCGCN